MGSFFKIFIFGGIAVVAMMYMGVLSPENVSSSLSSVGIPKEAVESINGYVEDMHEALKFVKEDLPKMLEDMKNTNGQENSN